VKLSNRSFVGKEVFVGIDVHKRTYAVVAVCDGEGVLRLGSVPADPAALIRLLQERFKEARLRSAYEAGFSAFVLHRRLVAAGIDNIVVNPSSIPVASRDRVKTDRRDAAKLAELHSRGLLCGIRVPSEAEEFDRLVSRTREQLVRDKTRAALRLKAKLFQFGYLVGDLDREASLAWVAAVEEAPLPEVLRASLLPYIASYRFLHEEQRKLVRLLQQQAQAEPEVERLYRSVPGVGPISARVLRNELGDVSRFRNQRTLYSFTGLTPAEYSSGDHIRRGHISRQGSARLRATLVECAWRAIRRDRGLAESYQRLKVRRGGKRAIVAIARRLVGRIRACLIHHTEYRLAA
jgi:transposase